MEDEIIYEKNGKRWSRTQLESQYGSRVEEAISKFGFTQIANTDTDPKLKKIYTVDGKNFSREQLEAQYGERTDEAISKFGFQELTGGEPVKKKDDQDSVSADPSLVSDGIEETDSTKSVISQEEPLSWLDSVKNSAKNIETSLRGADDRLSIVAADVYEKLLGKEHAAQFYNRFGDDIDKSRADAYKVLERLEGQMKETEGLLENIKEGDVVGISAGIIDSMGQIVSTAVPAIMTAGVGFYTEMGGRSLYDYNTAKAETLGVDVETLYKTGEADFYVPAAMGVVGGMLERMGWKGATNAMLKEIKGEGMKKAVAIFTEVNKEGFTEWAQLGTETFNTSIGSGKNAWEATTEAFGKMFSEEGIENYLMGVAGSGGAAATGNAVKKLLPKKMADKLTKNSNQVAALQTAIDEGNLSEENKSEAQQVLDGLKGENKSMIQEAVKNLQAVDEKDFIRLYDIEKAQKALAVEAKAILADESLSEDAAQALYEKKQAEWDALETERKTLHEDMHAPKPAPVVETEVAGTETETVVNDAPVEETVENEPDVDAIITEEEDADAVQAFDVDEIGEDLYEGNEVTESVQTEEAAEADFINNPVDETETSNPQIYYRGVGNNYSDNKNEGMVWVSDNESIAKDYAGKNEDGSLNVQEISAEIKNPFVLNYKNQNTSVTTDDIVNIVRREITNKVKSKELSIEEFREVKVLIDTFINEDVTASSAPFHTKINQGVNSKNFANILKALGYDAVQINQDGSKTFGLLNTENKTSEQNTTVAPLPAPKPKKTKPFITKNKKYQIKRDANGKINIFNRRGRKPAEVSNKLLQKYREEFIDRTNFDEGDRAIKEGVNIDGLDEAQYVADHSNNAQEIASVLSRTEFSDRSTLDPKTEAIASAVMGGGVNLESFVSAYGHREGITNAYFSKNGKSLDMIAMSVANTLHNDYNANEETVTVAEIVKFIEENPNGVKELTEQNPIEVELLGKFEQLTGLPATPRILEKIAAREGINETATEPDVTGTDPQNDNWAEVEGEEYIEVEDPNEVPFDKGGEGFDRGISTVKEAAKTLAKLSKRYGIEAAMVDMGLFGSYGRFDRRTMRISINTSTTLDKDGNLTAASKATGYVPRTTAVHEFMHPFVEILEHHNPELYQEILAEAKAVNETEQFANIDHYSEQNRDEELVVRYMERLAAAEKSPTILQRFFTWLSELFYSKKKNDATTIKELSKDTTIEDLYQIFKDYGNLGKDVAPIIQKDSLISEIEFLNSILESELNQENPRPEVIQNFKNEIAALEDGLNRLHKNPNQTNLNNEDPSFKKIEQEKQDMLFLKAVEAAAAKLNSDLSGKLKRGEKRKDTAKAVKNELVEMLNEFIGDKEVLSNLTFGDFKRMATNIANADTAHGFKKAANAFFAVKRQADAKNLQSKWDAIRQGIKDNKDQAAKQMLIDQIQGDLNRYIETELKDPAIRKFLTDGDKIAIVKMLEKADNWKAHTKAMDKLFDMVDRAKAKGETKRLQNEVSKDRKAELERRKKELYDELKEFEKNFFNAVDNKSVRVMRKNEVKRIKDRLSALKNPTPTNVRNAINDLTDLFYDLESRKLMGGINKILSRKLTKLEGGRRKLNSIDERQAKILLHTKTLLKQMAANRSKDRSALDADTEFYETILAEYDALVNSTTMISEAEFQRTQALHIVLQIAKAKVTTNKKDRAELLFGALNEVTETWEVGRTRFQDWFEAKQNRIASVRNPMIDAANDKEGISQKSVSERMEDQTAWVSKIASGIYNVMLGKGLGDLITTFRVIDTKGSKETNDSVWTDMHERIVGASTEKTNALRKHAQTIKEAQRRIFGIHGTQTEVYGEKNLSELGMTMILGKKHTLKVRNKPVRDIENKVVLDENGEAVRESYHANFTESQLLNLWMHYQNPELQSKFDAAGYDADFMAEVDKILDPKAKEYGEFLFDFYNEFYDGVNEVYKNMYGHSLGRPAKYAGKLMHDGFSELETNLMDINKVAQTAAAKSTKERNANSLPILAQDVNNSLARYLYEMEHFKAYAEVHQEFNSVIESPVFKRVLMDNHPKIGKTLLDQLVYYRDNDMVRGGKRAEGFEAMDFIMSNFVKSTLAMKPTIALTQTLSWTNAISFLPSGKYAWKGYNPVTFKNDMIHVLTNSKYIQNRWDAQGLNQAITGLNTVTADQLFRDSGKAGVTAKQFARAYDKIQNVLMYNVKLGDMVGVSGSIPVYTGWKAKYLDQGYSETRAEIKAMRKFEAAVERAQQSQTAYGKSMAQDHPAGRYFAMFATSVLQNYRNSMLSFLELYRHIHPQKHGKGSVGRHVLTIMNYRVFQPLIYTYVAQRLFGIDWLFDDEDDDRDLVDEEKSMITALLLGNIQSVPLIGSALTLFSDKVFMKAIGVGAKDFTYGGVLSNPLSDEGMKLEENIDRWAKTDDEETEAKAKQKIFKSVMKLTSGLPLETAGNYLEIMKDAENIKDEYDLTERFWMVMGKSKTSIDFGRETRDKIRSVSKDLLEVASEPIPLE